MGIEPSKADWAKEQKALLGTPMVSDAVTGSYALHEEYWAELQQAVGEQSVMVPLVKHVPMNRRQMLIPIKGTGATLTWVTGGQGSEFTESSPTFARETITAYPLVAWISFTESMIADSELAVFDIFRTQFAEDLADELDNQILNGSSAPWDGLMVDTGVNEVTMGAGNPTFSDVDIDNLFALVDAVTYSKYMRGAKFFMSPALMHIIRQLVDANGNPIFKDPTAASPGMLIGYPVVLSDNMPTTSAVSTKFLLFGNPKFFILGDRKTLDVEVFDKTSQALKFEEVFLRAYSRWGGLVAIPEAFSVLTTAAS